jgi:hypothetical protein
METEFGNDVIQGSAQLRRHLYVIYDVISISLGDGRIRK